ncbi:MAG: hypothetical protein ACJ8D8_19855 [Microvirga sp.]
MKAGIVRRLTGYDLSTERLAFQRDIPDRSWPEAKEIARLPALAERTFASHPLTDEQAHGIARLLGTALPSERMDYFVEPFAAP